MERDVMLFQKGRLIMTGHQADVREKIEEMLEEELGFFTTLQEDTDDDEYVVYMHTDAYEDLDNEALDKLVSLGISPTEEFTTKAIKEMFNLEFVIV